MRSEESDLRQLTKEFALQIVWMFRDYWFPRSSRYCEGGLAPTDEISPR
jgi:hypothetical protein